MARLPRPKMIRVTSRIQFRPRQSPQNRRAISVSEPEQIRRIEKQPEEKRPEIQILNRREENSVRPSRLNRPGQPGEPGQPSRTSRRDRPNKPGHAGQPSRTNLSNPQSR